MALSIKLTISGSHSIYSGKPTAKWSTQGMAINDLVGRGNREKKFNGPPPEINFIGPSPGKIQKGFCEEN